MAWETAEEKVDSVPGSLLSQNFVCKGGLEIPVLAEWVTYSPVGWSLLWGAVWAGS